MVKYKDFSSQKLIDSLEIKSNTEDKRIQCLKCGNYFRNKYVYAGHSKIHYKKSIESIRKHMLEQNPAKRLEVRKKISIAVSGIVPWNKGKKWTKDKRHNKITDRVAENLKREGYRVFTTNGYVPDAIIIDFNKKFVKAFELNPGSIMRVGPRAKEKGYDSLIIKIRKNGKYARKNMDREIPSSNL